MANTKTTIRTYQKKFDEKNPGQYDFEHAHKIQEYLNEPLTIVKGFVRDGDFGERLTMSVLRDDETKLTVQSSSGVLIKQFKEEEAAGLPVRVKVVSIEGKNGHNYFSFISPEETN